MPNPKGPAKEHRDAGRAVSGICRSVAGDVVTGRVRDALLAMASEGIELSRQSLKQLAAALNAFNPPIRTNQRKPRKPKLDAKAPSRTEPIPVGAWNDRKIHNALTKLGVSRTAINTWKDRTKGLAEKAKVGEGVMRERLWLEWLWWEAKHRIVGESDDSEGLSMYAIPAFIPNWPRIASPSWREPWRDADPAMYQWRDLSRLSEDAERGAIVSPEAFLMAMSPRAEIVQAFIGVSRGFGA